MDSEEGVKTKDMKINELAAKINELEEDLSAKKTITSTKIHRSEQRFYTG